METYLSTVSDARDAQITKTDQWVSQRMALNKHEVASAEQRVTQFMQAHNLSEVQGSLTAAIQLSKDQAQLSLAREELSRQQAALNTARGGSIVGAGETLKSKTIQNLKERAAKVIEQISLLPTPDPRRRPLQAELKSVQAQIEAENGLILASLARAVQIASARVHGLDTAVQRDIETAQDTSVAGATLKQLTGDLEAKRQLYVTFLTQAGQARLSAEQTPTARILFHGVPPLRPVHSFGIISLLLGFFGGVAGAAGIIVMRSTMSINSTDEMAIATGLPVFGSLPDFKRSRGGPLVAETFRAMWVAMRREQNEGTAILVTSSETGEGKTTIAMTLARRFADDGFRVLLIDADLRRPRIASILDLSHYNELGLVLRRQGGIGAWSCDCKWSGLSVSLRASNPVKVLSSDRFVELLSASRRTYDYVILDSPPVLHVADPIVLAKMCQHIIFIVQAGRLSDELVREATQRFAEEDRAKMVTLLTRVPSRYLKSQDYYSGYVVS